MNYAVLSYEKNFTVFKYGNRIIRFNEKFNPPAMLGRIE